MDAPTGAYFDCPQGITIRGEQYLLAISMNTSRRRKILIVAVFVCIATGLAMTANSLRFHPALTGDVDLMAGAQQKSEPGIKVSARALGARESQRLFGEDLAKYDIQPLWLSIENQTDAQLVYLPIATDPEYYSPYEVSYRFHGALSFAANRARDQFFLEHQMSTILPPHSRTAGFLYGVLDAGVKYAHVVIAGNNRLATFDFSLPVPGPAFVGTSVRADSVYPNQATEDVDLETLRTTLTRAPCCTTNSNKTRDGDPLNLVVVGSKSDPIVPFIARGWHVSQKLNVASTIETAHAFILRDEYLTSPVSPLYVFGRREDVALQKAPSTISERIHARLWLTPYTFESRRAWIGKVSRDIGVRLTDQTWNLTTHKIGPDVDFDRSYLLQDLLMSGLVEQYGFLEGVRAAPASAPRTNLTGDPYYTDGLRIVIFLSDQTKPLGQTERLPWELPPAPSQEVR